MIQELGNFVDACYKVYLPVLNIGRDISLITEDDFPKNAINLLIYDSFKFSLSLG